MGFRLFPCFFCINQKFGINICFSADTIPNFHNFCLATSAHFRALSPGLLPLMRAPPHVSSSDKCALSCAITRTPPAYAGPSSYLVLRQVRTFVRYHQDSSRLRGPLLIFCLATSAHFRALSPGLLPLTRAPPHILSCDKCALSCAITRTPPAYAGPSS